MAKKLPKGWVETTMEEVVLRMTNGSNLKQLEEPFDGSFPISRIETIAQETIDFDRVKYVKPSLDEIGKFGLKKGDILFSHINSDKHLGKTAYFDLDNVLIHGINLLLIRSYKQYNSKLLNYLLRYYRYEGKFIAVASHSVNQSSINQKKLNEFSVLFPPKPEQERIVAKLDKLFAELEKIQTRIQVLNMIGEKFLNSCIIDSTKNQFFSKQKIGQFLEEGTERIGSKWKGLRLIGVSAKHGITDLRIGQKESFEKYKVVKNGDFIYNTMRVNIGSIAIYNGDGDALTSPDYVVFRVKKNISSQLLLKYLKSEQGLHEIRANTKGSVRARLYFKTLSEIRMPIAPVEIQDSAEKFLNIFNGHIKHINQIDRDVLSKLRLAILSKAFRGELVEQLPTDGDARELMEEIKKTKAGLVGDKIKE